MRIVFSTREVAQLQNTATLAADVSDSLLFPTPAEPFSSQSTVKNSHCHLYLTTTIPVAFPVPTSAIFATHLPPPFFWGMMSSPRRRSPPSPQVHPDHAHKPFGLVSHLLPPPFKPASPSRPLPRLRRLPPLPSPQVLLQRALRSGSYSPFESKLMAPVDLVLVIAVRPAMAPLLHGVSPYLTG